MSLTRKAAFGMVASTTAALSIGGMGTAHAAGDLYGAMAVGDDGRSYSIGTTWNYPDQGAADVAALDQCGLSNCYVKVRWVNGCAALANRDGNLFAGYGRTLAQAEAAAIAASGPNPNPIMVSLGSAEPSSVHISDSQCTGNAG
ncbi:DUF4189 domain-containing protein [Nocardia seriolae]|uniref:DUF4189 domain-containing protein n=1 Tax=Nocardia seriolae TaxID=37332 RepID=A0ABC9Z5Q2_9NOCA|nr:DUF4189 domain-containing protein [Nocardia seriolae]APB01046.1 hypothetical protein NS506_07018 [Nocardia seriolae]PSK27135.1 DUF4189 domain-containing protein [Nocardia seriolae]QOW33042.1 DUF4189 domain-containing protein [Nocardia seriolae]QUN14718.1 DUF4189 domain-containing protein [Nocardia seriolae]WNJ60767.1 DUF4189 domain-containing protein [Nocardia seriolae]